MVRKGKLAVFEGSSISETKEAPPTKIGVHVCDIKFYLHEIFENSPFLKVAVSLKLERHCPPKLVCILVTSLPTSMKFLS